jgi:hypothetical protein
MTRLHWNAYRVWPGLAPEDRARALEKEIGFLETCEPMAEVRLAVQPSYPSGQGTPVVYLGQGKQLDYLPREAKDALGW